ncbi:MAG: hypothetical protein H0X24_22915, partial [Ktedonobacterales bacterium]|nr:hypothetical protein [Ktedonobacterales bacterium]
MPECSLRLDFAALAAWRDGFTSARRAAQIAAHVDTCGACQAHLTALASMAQALRREDPNATAWQPRMWRAMQGHMAQAQQQGTAMQRGTHQRDGRMTWGGVGVILAFIVVLGLIASHHATLPGAAQRWQTASLPKSARAYFTISQEVPGLAYAITGNNKEDYPPFDPLQGTLWRTQDGGVHWQQIANLPKFSSASAPQVVLGNQSALVVTDLTKGNVFIAPNLANDGGEFHPLTRSGSAFFARQGKLYAFNPSDSLWRSDDLGQTWEEIPEESYATSGVVTSMALDYSTPHGWYRTVHYRNVDAYQQNPTAAVRVEHSTDDGYTWQVRQILAIPTIAAPVYGDIPIAALATNPAFPSRLCVAFGINDESLWSLDQHAAAHLPSGLQTMERPLIQLKPRP